MKYHPLPTPEILALCALADMRVWYPYGTSGDDTAQAINLVDMTRTRNGPDVFVTVREPCGEEDYKVAIQRLVDHRP